jgi:hypothetical protein
LPDWISWASMTFTEDPRIDASVDALPDWQQTIRRKVPALVHAADPGVVVTIKRRGLPYFMVDGKICACASESDLGAPANGRRAPELRPFDPARRL